jgi:hypothetical protein
MPNQLSESKIRMTYSEFADVFEALKDLALRSRTDVSQIVRNATSDFLRKHKHGAWTPAQYKTPAEIRVDPMRRISYTEWKDVNDELKELALKDRIDKSDLLRSAVHTYLANLKK